jgi:hypothetical protein
MARRKRYIGPSDKIAPSDAATYERALRLANFAMWTVALQRRRLKTDEPEDEEFVLRRWADFQLFTTALTWLRRAATLATKVPRLKSPVEDARNTFDTALPRLKDMRDVTEHIDEYAIGKGRKSDIISRKSLEVGIIEGSLFKWRGFELDVDTALSAAEQLFEDIKRAGQPSSNT